MKNKYLELTPELLLFVLSTHFESKTLIDCLQNQHNVFNPTTLTLVLTTKLRIGYGDINANWFLNGMYTAGLCSERKELADTTEHLLARMRT